MPLADKKTEQANKLILALNQRQRLISWIIFIVVLVLGYFTVLQGKISQLYELGTSGLSAKSSELEALNAYSQKLAELDVKIKGWQEKYKEAAADLNQVLPSKAQIPELIAQLDALVSQSGFTIGSLDIAEAGESGKQAKTKEATGNPDSADVAPDLPSASDRLSRDGNQGGPNAENNLANLHTLEITMTVKGGDYPAFKVLLNKIEKNIRLLDLVSIKFAAGEIGAGYSLILRTYYFSTPNNL